MLLLYALLLNAWSAPTSRPRLRLGAKPALSIPAVNLGGRIVFLTWQMIDTFARIDADISRNGAAWANTCKRGLKDRRAFPWH